MVFLTKFFVLKILVNSESIFFFNNSFELIVESDIANIFIVFSKAERYFPSSFSNIKSLLTRNIAVPIEVFTYLSIISGIKS